MNLTWSRIERWLWYAFLATAAWQTRIIVWTADPTFIEWRSASVFLSDVLMAALFVCALVLSRGRLPRRPVGWDWLLGLFFAAALFSLSSAEHLTVGIVALIRLVQFAVFYLYLRHWAWHRFDADRSAVVFVAGAVGQAMLGIAQYFAQHDLGLRWLGETLLRTDMRGVAVFYDLAHEKILRAYGTFPHPNVLAAYLMVAFLVVCWLWIRHGTATRRAPLLWQAVASILLVGMYLTFARTVIAVWVLAGVVILGILFWDRISGRWPNIRTVRRRLIPILITITVVSAGFLLIFHEQVIARMTIAVSDEAVRQRVQYNEDALASGFGWRLSVNWTGVGIGNFTTWLARFDRALPSFVTQPAHNIFLMAYSEIGLIGLLIWCCWLASVFVAARRAYAGEPAIRASLLVLLGAYLLIGGLDHFFWTLQQGRLLWWGVLALAAGHASRSHAR